jgi:hypothetical protein
MKYGTFLGGKKNSFGIDEIVTAYRSHLGINKDSPEGRPVQKEGEIYKVPAANGLHHVYFRHAA